MSDQSSLRITHHASLISGGDRLGLVVEGSLVEGLRARLDGSSTVEDLRVGKFVRTTGDRYDFFCLITDIQLSATDPQALQDPPDAAEDFMRQVLAGTTTYGAIKIQPMLMLPKDELAADERGYLPVRTVPPHFASVYEADRADFERVFGAEDERHFEMGKPLDMDVPVCLDLKRFVERSNGVFGKSGTGKSFLTRLLLCGVIKSGLAANLIFDMHSEYGHGARSEDNQLVQGLQDLFGSQKVIVLALDSRSDASRTVRADRTVTIGLNEIEVEDVALLQDELRLNATAVETGNLLVAEYGTRWIAALLDMDSDGLKAFADRSGAHPGALAALKRKLLAFRGLPFIREHVSGSNLDEMIGYLEQKRHVVLEFGQFSQPLYYMLVANVVTRRIHRRWTELMEKHLQSRGRDPEPQQLMITIEEAHKFLNSQVANQTIFGAIARELRKYRVTLLVVDQRPSGIDDEVLSQIGTRVTCQLNDDLDIEAVFSGVSGAGRLKSVLATLDSREQAMILGHALPMPVVIQARKYDDAFYATVRSWGGDPVAFEAHRMANAREYHEIFGSNGDDD
jgi:DNA helicase HerA-like ATPase